MEIRRWSILYDENSFLTECQNPDREALASSTLGGLSDMTPVVWKLDERTGLGDFCDVGYILLHFVFESYFLD